MAVRRPVVALLALAVAAGSAGNARAGSDGIDTIGEVPVVPTTVATDVAVDPPPSGGSPASPAAGSGTPASTPAVEKDVAVAPVIHCLWVTADMDQTAPGLQRQHLELADDLPDVPTPTPCGIEPASGAAIAVPTTDALAHVRPWSADDPGARSIEVWMIVSHATGPSAIDGTDLVIGPTGPDGAEDLEGSVAVGELTVDREPDAALVSDALAAGVVSGQIADTAAADLDDLVAGGWGRAVRATWSLSYLDRCGRVAVTGTASAGAETSTVVAPVEVPCYHRLLADFDRVAWGALVPGAETVVSGDHDRATSDRPSLFNAGNTPIELATTFEPLCSVDGTDTCFGDFGIELVTTEGSVHRIDPTGPGSELVASEPVVCPGDVVRLDVLVSTPAVVPSGDYAGSMDMVGHSVDAACEVGTPPASDPVTTTSDDAPTSTAAPPANTTPTSTGTGTPTSTAAPPANNTPTSTGTPPDGSSAGSTPAGGDSPDTSTTVPSG